MNELEILASLRDEVPLADSAPIERSVMTAIRARGAGRPAPAAWRRSLAVTRWPRPVLAGTVAAALGVTAFAVVASVRDDAPAPQVISFSGQPTAAWPAGPSYGRAGTEAQLIAYVSRVAALPQHPPKANQWIVIKTEYGKPGKLKIDLTWNRFGPHCASAELVDIPASTPPDKIVSRKIRIDYEVGLPGCMPYVQLEGWKSVSYSYLNSLPTDPAALEPILVAGERPLGPPNRNVAVFDAIDNLLTNGASEGIAVPPRLLASLYRVLRRLPGVHFENTADLVGRTGLGFWTVEEGYIKDEIVIDPVTYVPMGEKAVAIKDHISKGTDGTTHIHKGDVLNWVALLGTRFVQHVGQLP